MIMIFATPVAYDLYFVLEQNHESLPVKPDDCVRMVSVVFSLDSTGESPPGSRCILIHCCTRRSVTPHRPAHAAFFTVKKLEPTRIMSHLISSFVSFFRPSEGMGLRNNICTPQEQRMRAKLKYNID